MQQLNRAFLLVLCAGLLASPVHAEKADRDKPINLEADTVTIDDIRKISVYEGNVILSQGTLMLRADRVQVTQSTGGLDKLVATGRPVSFRQKLDGSEEFIEGYARRIEYEGTHNQLELIGEARLRRGADELRGAQISYNANTEFFKVVGQTDTQAPAGRVRAVIRPKPRTDQPTQPDQQP